MSKKGVTSEQMSEIDRRSQNEYGIPQAVLMENAGKAVAEEVIADIRKSQAANHKSQVRIAVLCGKGNNGGDGFVVTRVLNANGMDVTIYTEANTAMKDGAARDNFKKVMDMKLAIRPLNAFRPQDFDVVVDAMFGTGFKGDLTGEFARIGETLNAHGSRVIAVDTPSGLDATTGKASDHTPKACKTVTFGLPKTGFFLNDGPRLCGEVVVKDIGFPPELLEEYAR